MAITIFRSMRLLENMLCGTFRRPRELKGLAAPLRGLYKYIEINYLHTSE